MNVVESALQGGILGAAVCGIAYGVRRWMRPIDGQPANEVKRGAASAAMGGDGTILPVRLSDAGDPASRTPEGTPAEDAARNVNGAAKEKAVGWLVARSGAQKGRRYDLIPGEIRIGRSENCPIRIDDDEEVSREHAMIRVQPQECRLCDLGSRNGTFLNGARVETPRRLQEGDTLRIGGAEMTFIRA